MSGGLAATLVAFALLLLIGGPTACTMHQNAKIAAMVRAGADPMLAACALRSDGHEPVCLDAIRLNAKAGVQ